MNPVSYAYFTGGGRGFFAFATCLRAWPE